MDFVCQYCSQSLSALIRKVSGQATYICPKCSAMLDPTLVNQVRSDYRFDKTTTLGLCLLVGVPALVLAPFLFIDRFKFNSLCLLVSYIIVWVMTVAVYVLHRDRKRPILPGMTPKRFASGEMAETRGPTPTLIVSCPECHQHLRISVDKGKLVVHCPKCSHSWGWKPVDAEQRYQDAVSSFRANQCPNCEGVEFSLFQQVPLLFMSCLRCSYTLAQCPYCQAKLNVSTDKEGFVVACTRCNESWDFKRIQTHPTRCPQCQGTKVTLFLDSVPPFVACLNCPNNWDLTSEYQRAAVPSSGRESGTGIRRYK